MYINYSDEWKYIIKITQATDFSRTFTKDDFTLIEPEGSAKCAEEDDIIEIYYDDTEWLETVVECLNKAKNYEHLDQLLEDA